MSNYADLCISYTYMVFTYNMILNIFKWKYVSVEIGISPLTNFDLKEKPQMKGVVHQGLKLVT